MRRGARFVIAAVFVFLAGCTKEARDLGSDLPLTAPTSAADPRIRYFQDNVFQVGQGGRYFGWYGCAGCHGADAQGWLDLGDGRWRRGGGFDQVFRAIAAGHGGLNYGARIPQQQLWQLTAYVRDMSKQPPEKLRRQTLDQSGEPTGSTWSGPSR